MNKTCLIIGGGMGGLFTGAFLAKNSVKVTVLEKNEIIGGGLQCFQRKGKIFDELVGLAVVAGNAGRTHEPDEVALDEYLLAEVAGIGAEVAYLLEFTA